MTDPSSPDEVAGALLRHLGETAGHAGGYAERPARIHGGNRTFVYGFRLAQASDAYSGPLILRVLRSPDESGAAQLEAVAQAALSDLGYAAPRILAWSNSSEPLGGPFQIMERLPGQPLVLSDPPEEMTGRNIFTQMLPELRHLLLGDWPRMLAEVQVQLHGLDAELFLREVEGAGLARRRFSLEAAIVRYAEEIDEHSLDGLRPGNDWLKVNCPDSGDGWSICRGDFFPKQVLTDGRAITGVIDWGDLMVGPAELDVGIVKAGLETLPAPLGRLGLALQRWLARKYVAAYRGQRPLRHAVLGYGEALRCLCTLLTVAARRLARAGRINAEPWPNPHDHPVGEERLVSRFLELTSMRVHIPAEPSAEAG